MYIEKYFAKYYVTFRNTPNNTTEHGCINIGVVDFGYISGIPIYDLANNKQDILNYINEKIAMQMKLITYVNNNNKHAIKYKADIEPIVEIIELENNTTDKTNPVTCVAQTHIQKIKTDYDCISNKISSMDKYSVEYKLWKESEHIYCGKLLEILNNEIVKNDFMNYITKNYPQYIKHANDDIINNVVLNNTDNGNIIIINKLNNEKCLMNYRDMKQNEFKKIKPNKPFLCKKWNRRKKHIYPNMKLLVRLVCLIDEFSKPNTNITHVLIKIKVPLQQVSTHIYGFNSGEKYKRNKRTMRFDKNGIQPHNELLELPDININININIGGNFNKKKRKINLI